MPARQTCSLHCTRGSSDKVYNMQLEEVSPGKWYVFAQNGRRGGTLTERTKIGPTSYGLAKAEYDKVLDEKIRTKGYDHVALSGKSLPTAAPPTPKKAKVKLPKMPAWPDFEVSYAEVATYLGQPASLKDDPQPHIVLLVDVAAGAQEGIVDAVNMMAECRNNDAVIKLLSDEGKLWLAQLSKDVAEQALDEMRSSIPF